MYLRQLYYLKRVMKQQWFKPKHILELQLSGLKAIVKHAYKNVPFYRKRFREFGIKPSDIKTLRDIKKLPTITREELIKNYPQIVAGNYKKYYLTKRYTLRTTSGSSGESLSMMFDGRAYDYLEAVYARALFNQGYNPLYRLPYYWYEPFKKKLINHLGLMRKVYISNKLSEEEQIKILAKLKPKFICYFPSTLYSISRNIENKYLKKIQPKAIFTHAEILSKGMRKQIENTFSTEVFDSYGSAEFDRMAWECKEHNYHTDEDSMIVEFLRGNEDVSPNEQGDVVVTGLVNYMVPLVRYRIGDKGVPLDNNCGCGRGLSLLKSIDGRLEDFIKLPSGKVFAPCQIIDYLNKFEDVKIFKVTQKSKKTVSVEFIPKEEIKKFDVNKLKIKLNFLFNNEFNILIKVVTDIPKTSRGKIPLVKGI